jgi:hypothetical protein
MSQNKIVEFTYTLNKITVVDGKEVKTPEKKQADVEVIQFESVSDILAFFEASEAGTGETALVKEINDAFKAKAIATKRAELTRIPKVPNVITNKAKEMLNVDEQNQLFATLAKLGLKIDNLK